MIGDRGFNEATVDDIVAAAHTSKSAFYEFWSSREDCLRSLLEERGSELVDSVVRAAAGGTDHRDRIRLGLSEFVRCCSEDTRLARLLLVESVAVSPGVDETRQRLQSRFARLLEAEARLNAIADPFYRQLDPDVYGRAVVGAVEEAAAQMVARPGAPGAAPFDPDRLVRGLCAIFAPPATGALTA